MEQEIEHVHAGPWGEFPDRYWGAYFGDEAPYYMGELDKLRNGRPLEFRFATFFLGLLWMVYRKMYVVATCALILTFIEGTIEESLFAMLDLDGTRAEIVAAITSISLAILEGFFANRVYLWDARRNIRVVMQEAGHRHEQEIIARIASRGDKSVGAVFALIGIVVVLALVAANILDMANSL